MVRYVIVRYPSSYPYEKQIELKGPRIDRPKVIIYALGEVDNLLDKAYRSYSRNRAYESWKVIFTSQLAGFIQSRLYAGDWYPSGYKDFALHFGSSSWLRLRRGGLRSGYTFFNISSFASSSLMLTIRKRTRGIKDVKFLNGRGRPRLYRKV